jgi:hypothetical protein
MRLLAALAYLCAGMWLFFWFFPEGPFGFGLILFFALVLSSVPLFNKGLLYKLKGQSYQEYLAELEARGKLENETHHPTRALFFEDLDTGCAAFFLDIGARGILCLYGQDLFQYEPGEDKDLPKRVFPCSPLTLRRLKKSREILDIVPQGKSFEPFVIPQPHRHVLRALKLPMRDGDIYTHIKYNELLSEFSRLNN